MSNKKKFVPVMLTPFHKDGRIDYDTLARLTAYYLEAGATGLFANCLSSEMFELTAEERVAITAFVVKETRGIVPVFSTGTFGGPVVAQAEFSKRIYDTGVFAVVAITSLLAEEKETDGILLSRTQELLALTGNIPFGFYECPVPYKRLLTADVLKKIVETNRILYYKDTSLSIDSIREKLKLTADYPEFELYDAYMVNAVASLKAGCAGLSCIQGNFAPELISWICENHSNAAYENQIVQVQRFLVDTMTVMHDVYPIAAKYFLQAKGFPIELATRRDVGALSEIQKNNLDRLVKDYEQLQKELGLKIIHA